jgi:hypothetical protein
VKWLRFGRASGWGGIYVEAGGPGQRWWTRPVFERTCCRRTRTREGSKNEGKEKKKEKDAHVKEKEEEKDAHVKEIDVCTT